MFNVFEDYNFNYIPLFITNLFSYLISVFIICIIKMILLNNFVLSINKSKAFYTLLKVYKIPNL